MKDHLPAPMSLLYPPWLWQKCPQKVVSSNAKLGYQWTFLMQGSSSLMIQGWYWKSNPRYQPAQKWVVRTNLQNTLTVFPFFKNKIFICQREEPEHRFLESYCLCTEWWGTCMNMWSLTTAWMPQWLARMSSDEGLVQGVLLYSRACLNVDLIWILPATIACNFR